MKRTIINPHWTNNARTIIAAEYHYDNGTILNVTMSTGDTSNPDLFEILSKFTQAEMETNTQEKMNQVATEAATIVAEQRAEINRAKREELVIAKMEAFKIPTVKNSTNTQLHQRIRNSTTLAEIDAWTAALLLYEYNLSNT